MPSASPTRFSSIPLVGNLGYPIALKEVRSLIRRGKYFWAQFFYLAVLAVGVVIVISVEMDQRTRPEEVTNQVFVVFFVIQNFLVYLVFPAFAATSISGERVEKSYDLLITTDLNPAEIIWGKFIGVFGGCCYFLVVTLPILGTCVLFGGKSVFEAVENYALLFLQAALLTIYGIFVSCAANSNIRAILGTYALAFICGGFAIGGILAMAESGNAISLTQFAATAPPLYVKSAALIGAYAVITVFGLCFLGAVQRLMSPESNRSMALRIFVFLAALAGLGIFFHLVDNALQAGYLGDAREHLAVTMMFAVPALCLLFLCSLIFAGSPVHTPLRVRRDAARRPWRYRLVWVFLPGGTRGLNYAVLLMLLTWFAFEVLGMIFHFSTVTESESGFRRMPVETLLEGARMTWIALIAGCFTYAALAFLLSALDVHGVLNLAIVVGCAILASCYATTFYAMELTPQWIHLYPLSLLVSLIQFWNAGSAGAGPELVHSIFTHLGIGVVCYLGGCLILWRRGLPVVGFQERAAA